ncbi:MAG TPA: response regulator [Blastocatellia bacterium]|nr:response regulator [Blastocatellia bacterium]
MTGRILLADDSITIQKVVNRAFAEEGIEVVAVSNGDQAERQLAEVNPDLVLADIFMPGKNGYELCESIKQNPKSRHIPVVLLVGAFEPFDQTEAKRVRADDHLTKPFEFRALIETVRRLMNTSAPQQTGPLAAMPAPEEETVEPLEPMPTGPLSAPPLNIDLAAMTEPVPQAEPAVAVHNDSIASFDESAPLDLDETAQIENPGVAELNLAPESFGNQTMVMGSPSWPQSSTMPEHFAANESVGPLDLGDAGIQTSEMVMPSPANGASAHEAHTVAIEAGDAVEQSAKGAGVPSMFGAETEDVVLDFEKSDMPEPQAIPSEMAFNPEEENLFEIMRDESPESSSRPVVTEHDRFITQRLDPSTLPDWKRTDTQPIEAQAVPVAARSESDSSFTELAVDNPLGDLLSDESAAAAPAPASAGDALELEFSTENVSEPSLQATIEMASPVYAEFHTATIEAGAQEESESAAGAASEQFAATEPLDSGPAFDMFSAGSNESAQAENVELTGSTFEFASPVQSSAAQEQVEPQAASVVEQVAPSSRSDESFTSSAQWSVEETRFAPIDIEAVAVDEPATQPAIESRAEETGFDFAPTETDTVESAAVPMVEEAPTVVEAAAEPVAQTVQLSPAQIDEIVARVTAQISDAVVREIAWEVVPDVVERVIEKLARESLAKKM